MRVADKIIDSPSTLFTKLADFSYGLERLVDASAQERGTTAGIDR